MESKICVQSSGFSHRQQFFFVNHLKPVLCYVMQPAAKDTGSKYRVLHVCRVMTEVALKYFVLTVVPDLFTLVLCSNQLSHLLCFEYLCKLALHSPSNALCNGHIITGQHKTSP